MGKGGGYDVFRSCSRRKGEWGCFAVAGKAGGIWGPGEQVSERSLLFPSSANANLWVNRSPTATLCYSHTCRELRQRQDWRFCSGSTSIASRTTGDMELELARECESTGGRMRYVQDGGSPRLRYRQRERQEAGDVVITVSNGFEDRDNGRRWWMQRW